VLSSHAVEYGDEIYCMPCFQVLKSENSYYRLQ
jgi:hypothetical protein